MSHYIFYDLNPLIILVINEDVYSNRDHTGMPARPSVSHC